MILLDTHALVWWIAAPERIPAKARRLITRAVGDGELLAVSSISLWEIMMLVARRRLQLTMEVDSWVSKVEALPFLEFLPVDNHVARRSATLDDLGTRDPADRMIVATGMQHGATLVTADARLRAFPRVKTVWD